MLRRSCGRSQVWVCAPARHSTLFGLLASTGLRISEALALTPTDVDLRRAALTVRETKFRKSRLVPVHPTTVAALMQYAEARRQRVSDPRIETFLISDRGTPLDDRTGMTVAKLRARSVDRPGRLRLATYP